MGVVIEICIKYSGGRNRIRGTDILYSSTCIIILIQVLHTQYRIKYSYSAVVFYLLFALAGWFVIIVYITCYTTRVYLRCVSYSVSAT
jgi:hypothetical protein